MEQEGRKDGGFETEMQSGRIRSALAECVKDPDSWKEQVEAVLQPSLGEAEARVTLMMQHFVESIESQLLSALKQASMDIIQHLGKEAAMRVLVAERNAVHFEQDLVNTKQEASNMLVHLKQNMDAQIIEAERACHIERKRAQEMEAKLLATQDTVKKLMIELKEKGEVLEHMQTMAESLDEHRVVPMCFPTEYSTMQWISSARHFSKQNSSGKDYLSSVIMNSEENILSANGLHHGIYGETINEVGDVLPALKINENKRCLSGENDFSASSIEKGHVGGDAGDQGQTVLPVADASSLQKEEAGYFLHQSKLVATCTGQCGSCEGGLVQREVQPSPSSDSDASPGTEDKPVATKKSTVKVRNEEKQQALASFPEICNASFCPQDRETKTWGSESSKILSGDEIPIYSGVENSGITFEDDCRISTELVNDVIGVMSTLCRSTVVSSPENGGIALETVDNQVSGDGVLIEALHSDEKTRISAHLDITKQESDKEIGIGIPSAADDSKCCPSQMRYIEAGQSSEIKISTSILDQCVHIRPSRFTFQRKRRRESPFQQTGKLLQEENDLTLETKKHECIPILSGKLPQKHRTTNLMSQKSSSVAESSGDSR